MIEQPKKMSEEKPNNWQWYYDYKNPKMLINLPRLFETHLDVDTDRFFASYKLGTMRRYMERGYTPNTLMGDVAEAVEHYGILKEMFKLQ